jgi:hypothetical protein
MAGHRPARIGRVRYTHHFARDYQAMAVFDYLGIVPLHLEFDGSIDQYILTGVSHRFDEIGDGQAIPEYWITLHRDAAGMVTVQSIEQQSPNRRRAHDAKPM